MRLTRSQRRADHTVDTDIHIDNTATEAHTGSSSPTTEDIGRSPLKEIAITVPEEPVAEMAPKKKAAKGKGKGRGRKAKKEVEEVEDAKPEEIETSPEVLEDERKAAASPASEAAEEELRKDAEVQEEPQPPVEDPQPAPPSRAVRRTRRQLAQAEAEEQKVAEAEEKQDVEPETVAAPLPVEEAVNAAPETDITTEDLVEESAAVSETLAVEEPAAPEETSEAESPMPSEPEQQLEEILEASDKENVKSPQKIKQILSPIKVPLKDEGSIRSISQSPSRRTPKKNDSIEALDALEDAMEEVGKSLPNLTPGKTRVKPKVLVNGHTPTTSESSIDVPTPAPKLSRTPRTVKSVKENAIAQPTKRPAPVAAPKPTVARSQSTRAPSAATKPKPKGTGEVVDYLASKRRPVSVSFPTPPPVAKSTRAPTKPTFTLPGEAIAAKLKAAREARQQKESVAEDKKTTEKKPLIKARPVPKPAAAPPVIKQTAASKAREAAIAGVPIEAKALQRSSSITASAAGKRQSTVLTPRRMPGVSIPPPPPPAPAFNSAASKARVPSAPRPRVPSATATTAPQPKTAVSAKEVAAQRVKGREVFNRARQETVDHERVKREKEDAARKARAEAAERGRIASREWAERQKRKVEGVKVEGPKVEKAVV